MRLKRSALAARIHSCCRNDQHSSIGRNNKSVFSIGQRGCQRAMQYVSLRAHTSNDTRRKPTVSDGIGMPCPASSKPWCSTHYGRLSSHASDVGHARDSVMLHHYWDQHTQKINSITRRL